jgi:hypothetical protein
LKEEIEKKLYFMEQNPPKIDFNFNPTRIVSYSNLTSIFTRGDLEKYVQDVKFNEIMFDQKECIVSLQKPELSDKLGFVVRGKVVQKRGTYESEGAEILYKTGSIIQLRKLA